ncbi:Autophagy protein 22 [Tulasnella sp. 408]|nr:Autophagy protein 22 [Tulasnella sp. 408]
MPATSLVLIGAITPLSGIIGSLAWPRLQRRLGWSNLRALVALVLVAAVIPLYGCLGFVPWLKGAKFGGLTTKGEMWALAVYFGSVYGAFQSYARSVFAELIPPGEEARWYGLYSITDKSSSFFGPLVVGLIADATGNIRFAFFFLFFMLLVPVPILLGAVDVAKGREDAARYSEAKDASAASSR